MFGTQDNTDQTYKDVSITPNGATKASVNINMGFGTLQIRGESPNLMDGHFEYGKGLEPEVKYDVKGTEGVLDVRQPHIPRSLRLGPNKWSMALAESIPLRLRINNGAGDVDIDLTRTMLERFDIDHAAGKSQIVLGGQQPRLEKVDLDAAAGSVKLAINGDCPNLRKVKAEVVAGNLELDLRGTFADTLEVSIELAAGRATVLLPTDANVVAKAKTTIGRVNHIGLDQADGGYVRHVANATRTIVIDTAIAAGNLNLEVAEA